MSMHAWNWMPEIADCDAAPFTSQNPLSLQLSLSPSLMRRARPNTKTFDISCQYSDWVNTLKKKRKIYHIKMMWSRTAFALCSFGQRESQPVRFHQWINRSAPQRRRRRANRGAFGHSKQPRDHIRIREAHSLGNFFCVYSINSTWYSIEVSAVVSFFKRWPNSGTPIVKYKKSIRRRPKFLRQQEVNPFSFAAGGDRCKLCVFSFIVKRVFFFLFCFVNFWLWLRYFGVRKAEPDSRDESEIIRLLCEWKCYTITIWGRNVSSKRYEEKSGRQRKRSNKAYIRSG